MKEEEKRIYREAEGKVGPEVTVLEALATAIYNEQSAFDFYTGLSEIIKNQSGKEKFKFLAADEKRHRELLEAHYKKLTSGKEFPFDPTKLKAFQVEVRDNTTAAEALDIGIKAEKEAYEFYSKAAEEIEEPDAKKMFLMLAEQEDGHYNLLTAEKQALTGQFYWFDSDTPGMMEY
ncbi:MAG: ferritin family protein [Candidatus Zixiibacteriota bacterium]